MFRSSESLAGGPRRNPDVSPTLTPSDSSAEVMEVDHDKQLVYCETLCVSSLTSLSPARLNGDASASGAAATANLGLLGAAQPSDEQVAARLSAPVVTTQLDTRNIAFERSDCSPPFTNPHFSLF